MLPRPSENGRFGADVVAKYVVIYSYPLPWLVILVSYYRPPVGCLQYNTASTGRITTFNFDDADSTHLANQQYSYCIRDDAIVLLLN